MRLRRKRWLERWTANIGYVVVAPPSLGNTYGSDELEVVVGLKDLVEVGL